MADEALSAAAAGKHEAPEVQPADPPTEKVAARSADGSEGLSYRKVFVLAGMIPQDHPQHGANYSGVLQEAVNRGLRPQGAVRLIEHEFSVPDRRGNVTTTAIYVVDVEPAGDSTTQSSS